MLRKILVYGHSKIPEFVNVFELIIISCKSYVIVVSSNDHKPRLGNLKSCNQDVIAAKSALS